MLTGRGALQSVHRGPDELGRWRASVAPLRKRAVGRGRGGGPPRGGQLCVGPLPQRNDRPTAGTARACARENDRRRQHTHSRPATTGTNGPGPLVHRFQPNLACKDRLRDVRRAIRSSCTATPRETRLSRCARLLVIPADGARDRWACTRPARTGRRTRRYGRVVHGPWGTIARQYACRLEVWGSLCSAGSELPCSLSATDRSRFGPRPRSVFRRSRVEAGTSSHTMCDPERPGPGEIGWQRGWLRIAVHSGFAGVYHVHVRFDR